MRLAVHIALQTAALVATGSSLMLMVSGQHTAALEARSQVEGDERDLETYERLVDSAGHFLLASDLILSGGTTYVMSIAHEQMVSIRLLLLELKASSLIKDESARLTRVSEQFEIMATVLDSTLALGHHEREEQLNDMVSVFDEHSIAATTAIDELRMLLRDSAHRRAIAADFSVIRAKTRTLMGMGVLITVILLSWNYLSRVIGRPIRLLAEQALHTSTSVQFAPLQSGPDEVLMLSENFSELVTGLARARDGLEETVVERTSALQHALNARSAFLANTSHELKTPMNAILGFVELLHQEDLDPEERSKYLRYVDTSGQHLLALIEDVLDFSKIDAGQMTIEEIPISPNELLEQVGAMLAPAAQEKGISLSFKDSGLPAIVLGDPLRLRQVLVNLVSNAIKFTPRGEVIIDSSWADGVLTVTVQDTGVGITEDRLTDIFDSFKQVDDSDSRKFGGTGLGLSISRALARIMDGDITVESKESIGTVFTFTLPAPTGPRRAEAGPAAPELAPRAGARVLLVDDVQTNRLLGRLMLERLKLEVVEAADGEEAVLAAKKAHESGKPFELVLMDLQMPTLDGYQATRHLCEENLTGPVIALSAATLPEQHKRAFEAGCTDFLSKPIVASKLREKLASHLPAA